MSGGMPAKEIVKDIRHGVGDRYGAEKLVELCKLLPDRNAAGFRISSLLKLADTKANKPGMNLLHFVALEAVKKDQSLLSFPSQLGHVGSASRAEEQLKEADDEVEGMRMSSQALMEFFCEDDGTQLEEACMVFHLFCHRFQRAVKGVKSQNSTYRQRLTNSNCPAQSKSGSSSVHESNNTCGPLSDRDTTTKTKLQSSTEEVPSQPQTKHRPTAKISAGISLPEASLTKEGETGMVLTPVEEDWMPSSQPEFSHSQPVEASALPAAGKETARSFSRVGETLECHTLVKGLRSYEILSPTNSPLPRPTPSLCSKWKKEREVDLNEGIEPRSEASKEEARTVKTPVRSGIGAKRGFVSRKVPSNSKGIPRVRSKTEPSNEASSTVNPPLPTRLSIPRSSSARSSPSVRPAVAQVEVKRSTSMQEKTANESQIPEKSTLTRSSSDRTPHEKVFGSTQLAFIRGASTRVSKRVAPNSETQLPSQSRTANSPSSATAKTIRTAVISAARSKTAKTTTCGAASPANPKTPVTSRIPSLKMPRSTAAQPLWR
ncbi:hypothetical protein GOODEAATRI_002617 [Goodea atripinnis]|uniref:FH2 domain-containing protein n=1 Tax=Goodea atripinnis TaxID=208336 RepID=A0ABV0MRQ9_9TELE